MLAHPKNVERFSQYRLDVHAHVVLSFEDIDLIESHDKCQSAPIITAFEPSEFRDFFQM